MCNSDISLQSCVNTIKASLRNILNIQHFSFDSVKKIETSKCIVSDCVISL